MAAVTLEGRRAPSRLLRAGDGCSGGAGTLPRAGPGPARPWKTAPCLATGKLRRGGQRRWHGKSTATRGQELGCGESCGRAEPERQRPPPERPLQGEGRRNAEGVTSGEQLAGTLSLLPALGKRPPCWAALAASPGKGAQARAGHKSPAACVSLSPDPGGAEINGLSV